MTKVLTVVRAERCLTLAHMCVGRRTTYSERADRGSIVRRGILNPQMHTDLIEDCSSDIIGLAFAAGIPDPGGYSYRAVGNTTSLRENLHNINPADVLPGDILLYRTRTSRPTEHAVLVLGGKGHTSDVYSFGEPPHPIIERADYRDDYLTGLIFLSKILGHRK